MLSGSIGSTVESVIVSDGALDPEPKVVIAPHVTPEGIPKTSAGELRFLAGGEAFPGANRASATLADLRKLLWCVSGDADSERVLLIQSSGPRRRLPIGGVVPVEYGIRGSLPKALKLTPSDEL